MSPGSAASPPAISPWHCVFAMALRFRDGSSVFPTSIVPAGDCDNGHTLAHPAPTTAANLGALARRVHRLKTEGLLSLRQPEPGVFVW